MEIYFYLLLAYLFASILMIACIEHPNLSKPATWLNLWPWVLPAGLIVTAAIVGFFNAFPLEQVFTLLLIAATLLVVGIMGILVRMRDQKSRGAWANLLGVMLLSFGGLYLLTPALFPPRHASESTACRNRLKEIGLAIHNYHDDFNSLPPASTQNATAEVSWRTLLLPYLDQAELYSRYNQNAAWDAKENQAISRTFLNEYACPASQRLRKEPMAYAPTDYAALVGENTCFPVNGSVSFRDITNGTSSTIMIVEAANRGLHWAEPKDIYAPYADLHVTSHEKTRHLNPLIASEHPASGFALMADGSVRRFSSDTSPGILKKLINRNDGIPLEDDKL